MELSCVWQAKSLGSSRRDIAVNHRLLRIPVKASLLCSGALWQVHTSRLCDAGIRACLTMNLCICSARSQGFFVALRLVASAQSGQEVSLSSLNLNAPPPKFVSTSSSSAALRLLRSLVWKPQLMFNSSEALRRPVWKPQSFSHSVLQLHFTFRAFSRRFYPNGLATIHTHNSHSHRGVNRARRQPSNLPVTSPPLRVYLRSWAELMSAGAETTCCSTTALRPYVPCCG